MFSFRFSVIDLYEGSLSRSLKFFQIKHSMSTIFIIHYDSAF